VSLRAWQRDAKPATFFSAVRRLLTLPRGSDRLETWLEGPGSFSHVYRPRTESI
jgi:hypothetical protein